MGPPIQGGQTGVGFKGERAGPLEKLKMEIQIYSFYPGGVCLYLCIHLPDHSSYGRIVILFFLYSFILFQKTRHESRSLFDNSLLMVNFWLWCPVVWDSRDTPKNSMPFIFGDPSNPNHWAPNHELIQGLHHVAISTSYWPRLSAISGLPSSYVLRFSVTERPAEVGLRLVTMPRKPKEITHLKFDGIQKCISLGNIVFVGYLISCEILCLLDIWYLHSIEGVLSLK